MDELEHAKSKILKFKDYVQRRIERLLRPPPPDPPLMLLHVSYIFDKLFVQSILQCIFPSCTYVT